VIYIISVATVNYNINDEEKLDQWDCFKNYKTPSAFIRSFLIFKICWLFNFLYTIHVKQK
jgi:hypothetical protein